MIEFLFICFLDDFKIFLRLLIPDLVLSDGASLNQLDILTISDETPETSLIIKSNL